MGLNDKMSKGDRVRLSAEGKTICRRSNPARLGTIVSGGCVRGCYRVAWDGNKPASAEWLFAALVELVENENKEA